MNELVKTSVYEYIRELLLSESTVVKDISKYELLISSDEETLPNVELSEDKVVIRNFTDLAQNLYLDLEELETTLKDNQKQIDKLSSSNALSTEYVELNHAQAEINQEMLQKQQLIDQMESLYKRVHKISKHNGLEIGKEIVFIQSLVTSEKLGISRELISRGVDVRLNEDDYSIEISFTDIVSLETDAFDISELDMYSEIGQLSKTLTVDNQDEYIKKVMDLLLISHSDLCCDYDFKQLVIRSQSLKSTIEDYNEIIDQIDSSEILDPFIDEEQSNSSYLINDNELYLALPTNAEQRLIAWKLNHGNVAVQGPPGTGKTHTIVNIISHMLAQGKSILVVSENKDALQVVHSKMPEPLQPLVIPMLGGSADTRRLTESSIKNIVSRVDTINVSSEVTKIERLKTMRKQLQDDLAEIVAKQIDSYVVENQDLEIYGETNKLAEWIQKINLSMVSLDDCRVPVIEVDQVDVKRLLSYDQSLLLKVVKEYINSKFLVNPKEFEILINVLSLASTITIESLSEFENIVDIDLPAIEHQLLEKVLNHWYLNPEEFEHDKQDVVKLVEFEKSKTKYKRILFETEVIVPDHLDDYKILNQLNSLKRSKLPKFIKKILNQNLKTIKVNNQNIWEREENIEILNAFCLERHSISYIERTKRRFTDMFKADLSVHEIEIIFNSFELIKALNSRLSKEGIDLFKEEFKDENFELIRMFIQIPKAAKAAQQFLQLKEEITSNIKEYDELYVLFNRIEDAIINRNFSIEDYRQFYKEAITREEKYTISNDILDIKQKLDAISPSLYAKLVSGDCDISILDYWNDNYIFTKVNEISKAEFKGKIEVLRKEISRVNIELVETMAWFELVSSIGPNEKQAMQTWITLVNKIGKGTGKNAAILKIQAKTQMDIIKTKVPVWITTRSQVADLFKFDKNHKFDLVIFDESSQSSLMALNVLERGKQKLIVGDDKQISPTSFINLEKASRLRQNHFDPNEHILISHDTTLFDYASAKYGVVRLKEHFRCLPEVIEFSNNLQYNGEMIPLRTINTREKLEPVVESVYIPTGYMLDNDSNPEEAQAIIKRIKQMTEDSRYQGKSIGIISLLSKTGKQEQLISDLLYNELGSEVINKFNIKVANSNTFQGDERDIILLSLVSARKDGEESFKSIALTKQMYYQRFNVAASRAKDKMILFHSITNSEIANKECVRFKILEFFENFEKKQKTFAGVQHSFATLLEEEMYEALIKRGYDVIHEYQSNGFKIDLVVEAQEGKLAIECDGERYYTREQFEDDFNRQAILERAGWNFYRIRARDYYMSKETTVRKLFEYLDENNLTPYENENSQIM